MNSGKSFTILEDLNLKYENCEIVVFISPLQNLCN